MTQSSQDEEAMRIVFVSGPSGAGRSTAIRALEDLGYEAIDNLPLTLLPRLLDGPPLARPLALGTDTRNRDYSAQALIGAVDRLAENPTYLTDLVYLDCDPEVLVRRYSRPGAVIRWRPRTARSWGSNWSATCWPR